MEIKVLPLFKTHYSLSKSTLTAAEPKGIDENAPISIFDIAQKHDLKEVIVVDDSISGFLELFQNSQKAKVKLVYGLRLSCVNDLTTKNDEMLKTGCKIIIMIKNSAGYSDLIKISSFYQQDGFYYHGNIDYTNLKRLWTDNLVLAVPFYDSFIFMNSLYGHLCVPNFSFTKPVFFVENSNLPFDYLVQQKVLSYTKNNNYVVNCARSIYYYKKEDVVPAFVYRCIKERSTLDMPGLDHFASDWFSFETWEKQNNDPDSVFLK
jgi:DNA polymerase III alpha subunit